MRQAMARASGGGMTRVADMSVPPEQRGRKREGKGTGRKGRKDGGTVQMDHASSGKAARKRRHGERLLRREREGRR